MEMLMDDGPFSDVLAGLQDNGSVWEAAEQVVNPSALERIWHPKRNQPSIVAWFATPLPLVYRRDSEREKER